MRLLVTGTPTFTNYDAIYYYLKAKVEFAGGEIITVYNDAGGTLGEIVDEVVRANTDFGLEPGLQSPEMFDCAVSFTLPDDPAPAAIDSAYSRGIPIAEFAVY